MKTIHLVLKICALGLLVVPAVATAQDADKDKIIAIEQEYAAPAPPAGSPTAMEKYMYDGPVMALSPTGKVNATSKGRLLAGRGRGNVADPDVKRETRRADFHVELYDDAALIAYTETVTETGHKDPALNMTNHLACLDTFLKRNGNWYGVSNACSYATPLPPAK
jgi:hypothetical protein